MIKHAMILAAGFGKRLNPLTLNDPKPLLKIGKETLLSNTLIFLKKFGVENVTINVHYLSDKIISYIEKNKFNLHIKIIQEKEKILDTGGGVLNVIKNFNSSPFIVINPDTLWNEKYIEELKLMEEFFLKKIENKCILLLVNKKKSFDTSFKGDFNLKNNFVKKIEKDNLIYIYTGLQIIRPEAFLNIKDKIFSINNVWEKLISINGLLGFESKLEFKHVSNLHVYTNLIKNYSDIK